MNKVPWEREGRFGGYEKVWLGNGLLWELLTAFLHTSVLEMTCYLPVPPVCPVAPLAPVSPRPPT